MRKLAGDVAIVTGGASGIGRAVGEELAKRGAEVVLADRHASSGEEAAGAIRRAGGKATAHELDVRDLGAFQRLARETAKRSGRIDFLFNNAGIGVGGEMACYSPEDWSDVFDVNLQGVANGIQAVYQFMIERRSGHIVNTASIAGLVAMAGTGSYAATKHAVVGLTKALRVEAKRHGVRASVLCPGAIRTPILTGGRYGRKGVDGIGDAQVLELWERARPMDPAVFAKKVVDAVLRNEAIIVCPSWWKALWYLDRLSPALSLRLSEALFGRLEKDLEARGAKPRVRAPASEGPSESVGGRSPSDLARS